MSVPKDKEIEVEIDHSRNLFGGVTGKRPETPKTGGTTIGSR